MSLCVPRIWLHWCPAERSSIQSDRRKRKVIVVKSTFLWGIRNKQWWWNSLEIRKFLSQVECFVIHSIGSLGSFRRNRVGRKGGGWVQREGKKCGNIKVNYSWNASLPYRAHRSSKPRLHFRQSRVHQHLCFSSCCLYSSRHVIASAPLHLLS